MTIFFSDVSHYDRDAGREIPDGDQIVIAKSTHGTRFVDSAYTYHRDVAAARGIYFTSYHWLNHGNGAGQADYCYSVVGSTPVMIDAEDMPGNTGYNGVLAVQDIANFITELRRLGGVSNLVYLPRWYWADHMGSPDLTPLAQLGVGLVSSNYTSYSDTGPGWAGYGGMVPVQWQFTSTPMDRNAYRGSVADYIALTSKGGGMPAPDFTRFDPGMEQMVADLWHFFKDGTGAFGGTELRGWYMPKQIAAAAASQPLTLTDAQVAALTPALVAAVTAAHDALTDADKPVIEGAVRDALTGVTLHVDAQ